MHDEKQTEHVVSCDGSVSRKEFLNKVIKGAALTGGLVMAPKLLDKFLVQPAFASASTCTISNPSSTDTGSGGACGDSFTGANSIGTTANADTYACVSGSLSSDGSGLCVPT